MTWRLRSAVGRALGRGGQPSGMRAALSLLGRVGVNPATVADVGASDGNWAAVARRTFPGADLVLFEPQPIHWPALERFEAENASVKIVQSAVGRAAGKAPFDATDPWGGVLQKSPTAGSITVSVVSLDEALIGAKPPFLVKLDTHGVEAHILAGAEQTLAHSDAWIIEACNQRVIPDCLLFWELCSYMAEHGFRPIDLVDVLKRPHDETLWQMDLIFMRSDWEGFNYLGYA